MYALYIAVAYIYVYPYTYTLYIQKNTFLFINLVIGVIIIDLIFHMYMKAKYSGL